MSVQCPACSKINPADAYYCYYDGRSLSKDGQGGPLRVGSMPFPTPFYFADGQACNTFNQLALACHDRWEEARGLLTQGVWNTFFSGIGRLDLAAAARQAAGNPEPDRGLGELLERLPTDPDCLRRPKLALESSEENLGQMRPGTDLSFELVVVNQGMLVLSGVATANVDWLAFGDRTGPTQKLFQTRNFHTMRVWVLGNKLRAGLVPLTAEIGIETNGGSQTLPVQVDVPVLPFPQGMFANDVLAGARSPREIALKAKEHPSEAAALFEQGAVKAWYASNGWSYPVEGTHGSGKGAVQQFFEALGLTKPPRLEIHPASLTLKARAGEHVAKSLTIRTEEAKPVYAQATSDRDWVTFGPTKYRGNLVTIPLEIVVPPLPGETVHARLTILGNGKQQFVVPVSLSVGKEPAARGKGRRDAAPAGGGLRWLGWFAGSFVVTSLLLIVAALLVQLVVMVLRRG